VYSFADDLISQTRYDAAGVPTTSYVQADGFGSTRWLTNAAGVITDAVDYDAFGNEIGRSGTTEVEHLYRGEAFDPNVGFYYLRARWMDPRVGRFTQVDPFCGVETDPTSRHRYLYAHASPISHLDPSGLITLGELGTAMNIAARQSLTSVGSYRVVIQKTGCLLVEAIVEETITHGIYVFLDELDNNKPYVGKTKNDLDRRMRQHTTEGARRVGQVIARINVQGGKGDLQVIEQLIYDVLSGGQPNSLSNTIRPLSERRPSKAELRKRLAAIKLCK
jgi:RHS repeat-associated protein